MKKKDLFNYLELIILFIAFICCFIPCVKYKNGMVINIYVFDANKIMGYLYMLLLIFGIVFKIYLIRKKKDSKIYNCFSLIIMFIATILYTISCILRRNIVISFSLGFYIVLSCLLLMIILYIIKVFTKDKKKKIKKN